MSKATKSRPKRRAIEVDVLFGDPKPSPVFTPEQLAITKFLTYSRPVACAHCGKLTRHHWTQLRFFRVMEPIFIHLKASEKLYAPLAPVCRKHFLSAERGYTAIKPEIDKEARPDSTKPVGLADQPQ